MGCGGISSWSSSPARILRTSAACSSRSSRVVANRRPLGMAPRQWPARPTRCMATRHRARAGDLADQVDVADIDAEFKRGRRYEDLDLAAFQALFGIEAQRARERAVVGGHVFCSQPLAQREGNSLHQLARVYEYQGGAVVFGVGGEFVEDLLPHGVGGDRAQVRRRAPRWQGPARAAGPPARWSPARGCGSTPVR